MFAMNIVQGQGFRAEQCTSLLTCFESAQNDVSRRRRQRISCSGSKLRSVVLHHRRMSTLSCFRAATFELVSCYGRLSGEAQKQAEGRGSRQGSIIKALRDDINYERDEQKWLREEQRWLREEQRWEREEARWTQANQALQEDVRALKVELEALRGQRAYKEGEITDVSLRNLVAGMRNLLQALAVPGSEDLPLVESPKQIQGAVPFSGETTTAYVVEESESTISPDSAFVASTKEIITIMAPRTDPDTTPEARPPTSAPPSSSQPANGATSNSPTTTTTTSKRILKSGLEGDDVKQLHNALSELGFYSGEEDIEFSVFSDGTESAVRTWQSTRGVPEDGKVTQELMESLLAEAATSSSTKNDESKKVTKSHSQPSTKVEATLRTKQPTPDVRESTSSGNAKSREIDRYERSNAQETGTGSSRRVYLLGENRWEEPGRVQKKQDEERLVQINGSSTKITVGAEVCFSCRGVGTTLCTDCEGTGDLNVEEQFLEWLDEGEAKCPYCEGSGAIQCDSCNGQMMTVEN